MIAHLLVVLSVIGPSSEHSFFYFAMSSPSGAAQASKAIGLIVEYLKKPENQAEARELCYSQRCSITLRNSYGCELTFSVARTV